MGYSKRSYSVEQVEAFLEHLYGREVRNIQALEGGFWSSAYAFRTITGDFVIRFAEGDAAFKKDHVAAGYASGDLPIPRIEAIGEAFGGCYAISERAFGEMLDDLDRETVRRVVPNLFHTLDAIRNVDLSATQGFGAWEAPGIAPHQTWCEALLRDADDWQSSMAESPICCSALNQAIECLRQLAGVTLNGRHLIHNDLLYRNVLVCDDRISGLFDWQCSLYGDFLYDIALLAYGAPWFPSMEGIDWEAEARRHLASIGLDVPRMAERMMCCKIHVGLGALGWNVYIQQWDEAEAHLGRILELVRQAN